MLTLKSIMDGLPANAITNYIFTEMAFKLKRNMFYVDFWPLSPPMLILTTPHAAAQLTQQFNPGKPPPIVKAFETLTGGPNLLTMPDGPWKRWRSIFSPGFSQSYMLEQVPKIVTEVNIFCERLREAARRGAMIQLEELTFRLTLEIIGVVGLYGT